MIIGLDVGGTKALGLAIDAETGSVRGRARRPSAGTPDELIETLGSIVDELTADEAATSVGLGIAGLVTRDGVVRYSPNLADLVEFPVAERLSSATGLPVLAANDASAGTWAEAKLGAGRGADDFAYVALGTGIGAGFVINGRLALGANGFAGEVGHVVIDPNGPTHITGRNGPWEYYASGNALGRMGREAAAAGRFPDAVADVDRLDDLVGQHVVELMRAGDDDARIVFDGFCREVARGLADLVLTLDPERIVIGGGLVDIGDPLIAGVTHWLGELLLGADHRPIPDVVAAELGADAAALGAALLAAER
ncbi:MAG: ROK family protein [Acidimicrobiales bacterium]